MEQPRDAPPDRDHGTDQDGQQQARAVEHHTDHDGAEKKTQREGQHGERAAEEPFSVTERREDHRTDAEGERRLRSGIALVTLQQTPGGNPIQLADLQRGQHGDHGQRNEQRRDQGQTDRDRKIEEQLPGHTLHEDDGQEDGDRGHRRRGHGARDLATTLARSFFPAQAHPPVPVDRLEYHDRVVDQHADTECQPP